MKLLLVLVLVLVSVQRSECVRCFAHFDLTSGQCDEEIGEVDEDDCCQNIQYGYQEADGGCQSCGPLVWASWSSWSPCTALCGQGVRQRTRKCFGIGQSDCGSRDEKLQTEPCSGTCCDDKGWGLWLPWSPCSVSCGEGTRKRKRICSSSAECSSACSGPSEETDTCPTHTTCPVHGGWSDWSNWSQCSGSCIDDQRSDVIAPSRQRQRTCSSPAPSSDTVPPGNRCPGDDVDVQACSELPNCPVDGSWGAWSPPGKCSASCGEGLQLSIRACDSPAPKYGGRFCEGQSAQSSKCLSVCAVDGSWSGWSSWGECSSSCVSVDRPPLRTRHRSCSNPPPSSSPPGKGCHGDDSQTENCNHLPHCSVDGGWGSWPSFSSCPVTCGVGLQLSLRKCDSPAPKHGGQPCAGEERRTNICTTNVHCPVDGVWSEWSSWSQCKSPFPNKVIKCKQLPGSQTRDRQCLHRAHNGSICSGEGLTDRRYCYDITGCHMKGTWEGWEPWTYCNPPCGGNPRRARKRKCKPDFSGYRPTVGRLKEKATFFGDPTADCGDVPLNEKFQVEQCLNVPACT
ncbi:properdin-like [Scomber japonicus]|uniref:properdin-like n=1 Tax=Scomber japonicus TaxID=13676 RepID=UPI002304DBFF|nr:properdin-like [Scomber japonicus]